MSTNTTTSKTPVSRASDQRSTIKKIDVTSFQLDESFGDNRDPYNSTGRLLVTAVKNRNRE